MDIRSHWLQLYFGFHSDRSCHKLEQKVLLQQTADYQNIGYIHGFHVYNPQTNSQIIVSEKIHKVLA